MKRTSLLLFAFCVLPNQGFVTRDLMVAIGISSVAATVFVASKWVDSDEHINAHGISAYKGKGTTEQDREEL